MGYKALKYMELMLGQEDHYVLAHEKFFAQVLACALLE